MVPLTQVRLVRDAHLPSVWFSRTSSRASAPKAFTTALQVMASASTPPTRVSQRFESCEAGATQATETPAASAR